MRKRFSKAFYYIGAWWPSKSADWNRLIKLQFPVPTRNITICPRASEDKSLENVTSCNLETYMSVKDHPLIWTMIFSVRIVPDKNDT